MIARALMAAHSGRRSAGISSSARSRSDSGIFSRSAIFVAPLLIGFFLGAGLKLVQILGR